MPARTIQPTESALEKSIPRIFNQVQESAANHKKNYVALHKIQAELAEHTEELQKGKLVKLTGERMFQDKFIYMLCRALPLKKGIDSADRTVKFVAGYVKFINEKGWDSALEERDPDDDDDESYASRFTARLLGFLLKGFEAKDKNVRFRVVQSVTEMISHLGAIEEDVYSSLHDALVARLSWDRETAVRYQAAIAVAKLSTTEDLSEVEEGESLLDKLLETLVYDSSPEVRRAALVNIPVNDQTILKLLDRTYDTDATIRKALYGSILPDISPRDLSMPQREFIVRKGLGDREPGVRAAAASLIATWIQALQPKAEGDNPTTSKVEDEVISILKLFDLTEDVAVDALLSVFTTRVDIFNNLEFNEQYWTNLTAETAFLARVFVEHCKTIQDETRLEASLPVVTNVAFSIEHCYKSLGDMCNEDASNIDEAERIRREDARFDKQSVIAELLKLAVHLDYSDEIGRRKMFQLVRDMLGKHDLPEMLLAPCLDVMRTLSPNERDLIRIVVETIHELRNSVDTDDNDAVDIIQVSRYDANQTIYGIGLDGIPMQQTAVKHAKELSTEQKHQLDRVNLKSLSLCIGMLERVDSTLEENVTLDGILGELIIPSVQRKDILFRERGLKCLALCCLIAKRLAIKSIPLFMSQISTSPISIKTILVEALFDIFMKHDADMFRNHDNNIEALTRFLMGHIKGEQDPKVKALLCKGTAKLVLAGMITDVDVIKNLIKAYLDPLTADNQELRQCLAFFLQMYSYSSPANQKRMCEIFIHVFFDVNEDRKVAKDGGEQSDIVSSAQVAAMFIDWTDPLRLSQAINARKTQDGTNADECVQLDMAEDILKILFEKDLKVGIEKEDKRVLCQMLNKLHVPDVVDDYRIRSLKLLMDNLRARRPLRDSACNAAFTKFETVFSKKFEKQLQHFTEEEFRKLEELTKLFEFLDSIIPLDDDENESIDAPRRSRIRRSESVPGTGTETETYYGSPPPKKEKGRPKSKRPRFSTSDDDASRGTPPLNAPTRILPKRSAYSFKPPVIIISSDSDEFENTPRPRNKQDSKSHVRSTPPVKEEKEVKQLNDDTEDLLDGSSVPFDSIMDSDSEEEEDEVNDLLAKV
ncbi:hypothetical protein BYT27DRAFT_7123670 [Phlegmacium glaucopus]|nr:hypothetical protein BYT27DRAFT_7123670 [Phlegmacium glaucopus]